MNTFRCLPCLLALLWLTGSAWAGWKTPREALDRRLASADFHIYYTLEGEHAFPADATALERAARATEQIDVLVRQLHDADRYYREELGLRAPLAGTRYATGRSIDIHILRMAGKSGSTGDELHEFHYRHFPVTPSVLTIALSNELRPTSLTPAHELFHAYQYGYTYFKNPWFLEGMARASEHFFKTASPPLVHLPADRGALSAVLASSYRAETLWNRIVMLCGRQFLRPLLENYERIDQTAARDRGIDPTSWPEKEQRAEANNRYLLQGLADTMEQHCVLPDNTELATFKQLLRSHYP